LNLSRSTYALSESQVMAVAACALLLAIVFLRDSLKFAAVVALAVGVGTVYHLGTNAGESVRNFFGVHKIYDMPDGHRILLHGTTIHGVERIPEEGDPSFDQKPEPLAYYHVQSGIAQGIGALRERKSGPVHFAVVGLGAGAIACYVRDGDTITFYEIDQSMVDVATGPGYFSYTSSCAPDANIVLGDARLTLGDAADGGYDLIVVDAFSSDAIPVHLLTREAMALYLTKLAPGGIVLMHVSN